MPILKPDAAVDGPVGPYLARELECRILTEFNELEKLAPSWDGLWRSDPSAEIFQSFTWARAWWECFGESFKLRVAIVYERGIVALILPLVESQGTLRFLGVPQADYSDMLCCDPQPAELLAMALRRVLKSVPGWKACVLENLRSDSKLVQAAAHLPTELRHLMQSQENESCPAIVFGEKRDEVIDSLLARKHSRRRVQSLQKAGELRFRHVERKEEAERHLSEFFLYHKRRCALLAKTSCFEDPQMCRMIQTLLEHLNLRQELRFGVLELNGTPLAWSIGFQINGKYSYYQQTFDVDAEHWAPGEVLLYYLLVYAKQSAASELDFLRGDEFFKRRFATHIRQTRTLLINRPGVNGVLRRMTRSLQAELQAFSKGVEVYARTHAHVFQLFRFVFSHKRSLIRHLRNARRAGALRDYLLLSASDLLRNFLWNKRVTSIFSTESSTADSTPFKSLTSDAGIDIVPGRFSDLVDLTLEHPELRFPTLHECRNRLKQGDRAYLVRENGRISLVAWTGHGPLRQSPQECSAAVCMYWCWPIQNPERGCTILLKLLGEEACSAKCDLAVCCPSLPSKSQLELGRRGLLPKSRIVSRTMFGWLRHEDVHEFQGAPDQRTADATCPKLRSSKKL